MWESIRHTKSKFVPVHSLKPQWGAGGIAPLIFNLELDGEWSASRLGRFNPCKYSFNMRLCGPQRL